MDFVRLWGKGEGGKGRGGRRGGVGEGVGGRRGLWGEAAFGLLPSLATAFAMMVGGDFMSRLQAGKRVWGGSWGGGATPGLPPSLATAFAMMVGMESDSTVSQ